MKKLGFIGLGIMGRPMVKNLLKNGFELTVYDLNEKAVEQLVLEGAKGARSPKEVAENSSLIFTMVPNSDHVKEVIFAENGLIEGMESGGIIVDLSSILPVVSKEIAHTLARRGIKMLDAPVSGGEEGAVDGTLAIMVGGNEETFLEVKPILSCMGKEINLVGENGAGVTAKLANQIIVNVNIAAMSEAFAFAAKAGIDVEKMYTAIRTGLAGSNVLDAKAPMILERNFKAGGSVAINSKDLLNILEMGESLEMDLPLSSQVSHMFKQLIEDGKKEMDHCGLVQVYEKNEQIKVEKGVSR